MAAHDPRLELAPRDVVARAIDFEMKKHGLDHVWLDATHLGEDYLRQHFPTIHARCLKPASTSRRSRFRWCRRLALHLRRRRHRPRRAHRPAGAVRRRRDGYTGCTAPTGWRATRCSNAWCSAGPAPRIAGPGPRRAARLAAWDESRVENADEQVVIAHNWDELRLLMWNYVGIVRTTKRLERALHRIKLLRSEIDDYYANFRVTRDLLELRNLVDCAELIVRSAPDAAREPGLHQPRLPECAAGQLPDRARAPGTQRRQHAQGKSVGLERLTRVPGDGRPGGPAKMRNARCAPGSARAGRSSTRIRIIDRAHVLGQSADRDPVDAGRGDGPDLVERDAARGLERRAAGADRDRLAHAVEGEVVEQHASPRPAAPRAAARSSRPRPGLTPAPSACVAQRRRHAAGRGDVVLLDQDAVVQRERRWFSPAADAHRVLLRQAQPGIVLRVSRIAQPRGLGEAPATASTYWRVALAVADSSCRKFSAGRSAASSARASPSMWQTSVSAATRAPSPACHSMRAFGVERVDDRVEPLPSAEHRRLAHEHAGAHALALGTSSPVQSQRRCLPPARRGRCARAFGQDSS